MRADVRRLLLRPDGLLVTSGGSRWRRLFGVVVAAVALGRGRLGSLLRAAPLLGRLGRAVEEEGLVEVVRAEVAVVHVQDRAQPRRNRGRVGSRIRNRWKREHLRAAGNDRTG